MVVEFFIGNYVVFDEDVEVVLFVDKVVLFFFIKFCQFVGYFFSDVVGNFFDIGIVLQVIV